MKRSLFLVSLVAVLALALTYPALAASPSAAKRVLADDGGAAVVLVRVSASAESVYGVTIKDASGSIKDIVAPEGWVGVSSGSNVIFRTSSKPIKAGTTLGFRLVTSNKDAGLTVSFRDDVSAIGTSTKI